MCLYLGDEQLGWPPMPQLDPGTVTRRGTKPRSTLINFGALMGAGRATQIGW